MPQYAGAGAVPLLYLIAAGVLAIAVAVETYFANDRWPQLAAVAVVGATVLSVILMLDDDPAAARLRRSIPPPACRRPGSSPASFGC